MTYGQVFTNRRGKPSTKICIGCGCLINRGLRCGPCRVCVPKTLSALISRRNHLTSVDHVRTVLLRPGRLGLAIQVEEPTV